jgi:hypothetical protein
MAAMLRRVDWGLTPLAWQRAVNWGVTSTIFRTTPGRWKLAALRT